MIDKPNKVNDFWDSCRKVAVASGIPPKNVDRYFRWAQNFAKSFEGKPLHSFAVSDIEQFLIDLSNQNGFECRQVRLVEDAIVLLYRGFLDIDLDLKTGCQITAMVERTGRIPVLNRPGTSIKSPADLQSQPCLNKII
jgi:hypothetical protein